MAIDLARLPETTGDPLHSFDMVQGIACEECGSSNLVEVFEAGMQVLECGLCGALSGQDGRVSHVLLVREAVEKGVHPAIYPLVLLLDGFPGLRAMASGAGDPDAGTWPFLQLALGPDCLRSVENVVKSLALSGSGCGLHWVLEMEYQSRLVATLKPRFHTDLERIGPVEIRKARDDLARIAANLQRDIHLSWWRA